MFLASKMLYLYQLFRNDIIMATIYLTQSSKTDTNNEREILIRFSHGKINQRAKTNIFLSSKYWNTTKEKINIPKVRLQTIQQSNSLKASTIRKVI